MYVEIETQTEGVPQGLAPLLSRLGDACLRAEGIEGCFQAGLMLTDDAGIAAVNRAQRGLNQPTDVLSFPSVQYKHGTARAHRKKLRREYVPETGCMHLGDIIISLPRGRGQAERFGHSFLREISFLFVHGMLHLLGHDHETDAGRAVMHAMEDAIMEKEGISRDLTDADLALLGCAREAMERAYAPYSGYRVGACVRAADGRLFKGCNVENASFGMAICAERNALTTAVAEGATQFEAIAVAAEGSMPYPCGACRQFLREFGQDIRILVTAGGAVDITSLEALLPHGFGPESIARGDQA